MLLLILAAKTLTVPVVQAEQPLQTVPVKQVALLAPAVLLVPAGQVDPEVLVAPADQLVQVLEAQPVLVAQAAPADHLVQVPEAPLVQVDKVGNDINLQIHPLIFFQLYEV